MEDRAESGSEICFRPRVPAIAAEVNLVSEFLS
jgi:hypothetical protein